MNIRYLFLMVCIVMCNFVPSEQQKSNYYRYRRSVDNKKVFLIYRYLTDTTGLCLVALKSVEANSEIFSLKLTTQCLLHSTAAQWKMLRGNLFQNIRFERCITANLQIDGLLSSQVSLSPCDPINAYQQWKCDLSCNLGIQIYSASNVYHLEHELNIDNMQVSGGILVLRLPEESSRIVDQTVAMVPRWLIYDKVGVKQPRCICKAKSASGAMLKHYMSTVAGGNIVGEYCVFPFIYHGSEVWQCIENQDGLWICATTDNLDKNINQWGVCPSSKRGTFSDWLAPAMCDKACGGGRVMKHRKCLFPPCTGSLVGVQAEESCNDHECTGNRVFTTEGHSHLFPVDDMMLLVNEKVVGECVFPFILDGEESNVCLSDYRRSRHWCSLTSNYDVHLKWGYCVEETLGIWTSWSEQTTYLHSCSKSCGGGFKIMTRTCHQPPCKGKSEKKSGLCNTQSCPDCYQESGRRYRGKTHKANDGTYCQDWGVQTPHPHPQETKRRYPELLKNYCRNPGNRGQQPYCYRNLTDEPSKMYCDIHLCSINANVPGIPYTIPVSFQDRSQTNRPCIFPYSYGREWFDSCFYLDETKIGREKCAISHTGPEQIRYCPSYFRGKWSDWHYDGECSRSCGGGYHVRFRLCYLLPCVGKAVNIDKTRRCNSFPCTWNQPGSNECFTGRGVMYVGTSNTAVSGTTCKRWTDVRKNHTGLRITNEMLPEGIPRLLNNYCRNPRPGAYKAPWCYVDQERQWEYCSTPRCPTREGEIFGYSMGRFNLNRTDEPCIFPFYGGTNKMYDTCTLINPYKMLPSFSYCGVSSRKRFVGFWGRAINPHIKSSASEKNKAISLIQKNIRRGLESGVYKICPPLTQGTWTSWTSTARCSSPCGGGQTTRHHRCLHPPCSKNLETGFANETQPCNTHKCLVCLIENGVTYRGNVDVGYLGDRCMQWSQVSSKFTKFTPSNYPDLTGNRCRNPGGFEPIPWCFRDTEDKSTFHLVYCDVPHCSDSKLLTIPFTIPGKTVLFRYHKSGKGCHFPFKYRGDWYYSCFRYSADGKSQYFCSAVERLTDNPIRFAICPPHYKGLWTTWNETNTCNKMCGGGEKLFVRECLYPPCNGSKYKFEGSCNTRLCNGERRWRENVDCFMGEGIAYVGGVSHTVYDQKCISWRSSQINHRYLPRGMGMLLLNKCRNPSPRGFRTGPWCYIAGSSKRWEYCDIPRCPTRPGEIRTFGGPSDNRPCHFPFISQSVKQHACKLASVSMHGSATPFQFYFCATSRNVDQHPSRRGDRNWGVCPTANRGTVSPWTLSKPTKRCTVPCGGGKLRYFRACRFNPCRAFTFFKSFGECNIEPCESSCFTADGTSYRGTKSFSFSNNIHKCVKWNTLKLSRKRYEQLRLIGDGDHNYCRNIAPSKYKMPFCFSRVGASNPRVVMCDMPRCGEPVDMLITVGTAEENGGKRCIFPFKVNGRYVHSCQPRKFVGYSHYCGTAEGTTDVFRERLYGFCSKLSLGTWSDWSDTGECSKPCGGGEYVQIRHCRYPPCDGENKKGQGVCNMFECNQRKNCYDVRTEGLDFSGNDPRFYSGIPCVPWYYYFSKLPDKTFKSCRKYRKMITPRPVCAVRVRKDSKFVVSLHMCKVPFCPDSVVDRIIVMPNSAEGRTWSPCVFPFIYNNRNYHQCISIAPPSAPEGREVLTNRWCGTVRDMHPTVQRFEWGYCPAESIGQWAQWSQIQQCTAICLLFQTRVCLHPPCIGQPWIIQATQCEHASCRLVTWGSWSEWTICESCYRVKTRFRECLNKRTSMRMSKRNSGRFCEGYFHEARSCKEGLDTRKKSKIDVCDGLYVVGHVNVFEVYKILSGYHQIGHIGSAASKIVLSHILIFFVSFVFEAIV